MRHRESASARSPSKQPRSGASVTRRSNSSASTASIVGSGLLLGATILLGDRHESVDERPGLAAGRQYVYRVIATPQGDVREKAARGRPRAHLQPASRHRAANVGAALRCGPAERRLPLAVVVPFESHHGASIDRLVALLAADMERVNAAILSRTGSEVAMIPEVANHLINSGGKRLRPMLTLAMAVLTDYPGDGHVKLAAAVEFMHTATLLHDDVVDESDMRRGKLAARMLWGNGASVLVGDFLLGQAFKMMVEVGSLRSLDILSSAAAVIAEGEVMQLAAAKNTATTEDEYLAVIRAKTAEL